MGQDLTVLDARGAVKKLMLQAFQRRHSNLEPLNTDPFAERILISMKRHNTMAAALHETNS